MRGKSTGGGHGGSTCLGEGLLYGPGAGRSDGLLYPRRFKRSWGKPSPRAGGLKLLNPLALILHDIFQYRDAGKNRPIREEMNAGRVPDGVRCDEQV